jgi:hypothetical protein
MEIWRIFNIKDQVKIRKGERAIFKFKEIEIKGNAPLPLPPNLLFILIY